MNRKDWASVTDEVIMDLESMTPPLHIVEKDLTRMLPRECYPNPISCLIAEVKRLREAFITAVRHVGEHDLSRDDLFSELDEDLFSLWLFRSE
jgi:hypothetical protein|tara:strand:+ start:1299 stop:1577 length:279 start_codon:yes stop_codon:yes gene_type:complete